MRIVLALLVFAMILLIYGVISEVFTVLFRLTGMPEEKARFQVISMLTGSGYTTHESEAVMNDTRRRDLARKTMLFGYVFNVTVISAIINVLFSFKVSELEEKLWAAPLPVLMIACLIVLRRNPHVKLWFDGQVQALAGRMLEKAPGNRMLVMDSFGKSIMAQLHLQALPPMYRNVALKDTKLREQGVSVMLVRRKGEPPIQADGATMLEDGDLLVVFGTISAIEQAFELDLSLHHAETLAE